MREDEFAHEVLAIFLAETDAWVRAGPIGYHFRLRVPGKMEIVLHVCPRRVVMLDVVMWTIEVTDGVDVAYRVVGPFLALEFLRSAVPREAADLVAHVPTLGRGGGVTEGHGGL